MTAGDPRSHRTGSVLVAIQFVLIAVLVAIGGPAFLARQAPAGAWGLAAAGIGIFLWALWSNRPGNFNIHPAPRAGGALVERGPYRWVRHPMYTAVIACGLAFAWAGASLWGWLGVAALVAVLAAKARLEERWMLLAHPEYAAYRTRTGRFLPGLL